MRPPRTASCTSAIRSDAIDHLVAPPTRSGNPNMVPDTVGDIHDRSASPLLRCPESMSSTAAAMRLLCSLSCVTRSTDFSRAISRSYAHPRFATLLRLPDDLSTTKRKSFEDFVHTIADQDPIDMDPPGLQFAQTLQEHAVRLHRTLESFDHDFRRRKIAPATLNSFNKRSTGDRVKPYH